ncbi:MAG TPA: hopanoid biosynthesis-associated protein HpnK [Methylomirabilota bacterium]|nr:hopanoid biosynthesis-associated protein HpnK [Methylomirabilota bacterium]
MARPDARRRLIVNADDFGRSRSINQAVIRAHREGILTSASLMVNEPGCEEAIALARENPRLGIGLHLTLLCGRSALPREKIPGLVNERGEFANSPVGAGMKYFFRCELRGQLEMEIAAQFERFHATGLKLDHVNGHLHMHMHPVVFPVLSGRAQEWQATHLRLTRDRFWLNAKIARGAWSYRISHAVIYCSLCTYLRAGAGLRGFTHTAHVFGLLQNARVNENYITSLLPRLPAGDSELYSHPSLDEFRHEFDALVSPAVKQLVRNQNIELIRYQDL